MGGKDNPAPPPPDYSAVSTASVEAAKIQSQTSAEQLQWAKDQYADQAPRTAAYMESMTKSSDEQRANAATDRARYQDIYQPTEDAFVKTANDWNSPVRAEQNAGAAMADVSANFTAARQAATAKLESFGIDPSQTRYGALDLGTRVSEAAAKAGAGTQSRLNTQATGLALQGEAINIGKGYAGQIAQSYSGATSAGGAGVNAGLQTSSTYGNMMGTAGTWSGLSNQSQGTATGALQAAGNYSLQSTKMANDLSSQQSAGMGQLAGGALMAAAIFA